MMSALQRGQDGTMPAGGVDMEAQRAKWEAERQEMRESKERQAAMEQAERKLVVEKRREDLARKRAAMEAEKAEKVEDPNGDLIDSIRQELKKESMKKKQGQLGRPLKPR